MKKIFVLLSLLGLFSIAAPADETIPPTPTRTKTPRAAAEISTTLNIRLSPGDKQARLIIPKNQLKQLRAELDELDDSETTAAVSTLSRTQTIASGLFLSLAFAFGGVWLVRSKKTVSKKGKIIAAGAFVFFAGAFATVVFGNIAPPRRAAITSELFNTEAFSPLGLEGEIKLEISDNADKIRLIVPKTEEPK